MRKFQIQTNRLPDSPPITDISGNGSSASPSSNSDPPYSPDNYGNYSGTFSIYLHSTWFLKLCRSSQLSSLAFHNSLLNSFAPFCSLLASPILRVFSALCGSRAGCIACSLFPPCPFPATRIHRRPLCRFSIRPLLFLLLTLFSYCQQPIPSHRLHLFSLQIWVEVSRSPARRIASNCV